MFKKKGLCMKKFRLLNCYTALLVASFLLLPTQVQSTDQNEAYISSVELHEMVDNAHMKYVYLGKEFSDLYKVVSKIHSLEDNKDSIISHLQQHVDEGFSVGLYDSVVEALDYAEKVLQENYAKISPEEAYRLSRELERVTDQVMNELLSITIEQTGAEQIDEFSAITRCPAEISKHCPAAQGDTIKVRGKLFVCCNARFKNNVDIERNLKAHGKAKFKGDVIFKEEVCFEDDVTFKDKVCFRDEVTFKDDVTFDEDVVIEGDLIVDGSVTINDAVIENLSILDVVIENLSATDVTIDNLTVINCMTSLCIEDLSVAEASVSGILSVNNEIANNITVENITASDAVITTLSVVDCVDSLCVENLSVVDQSISGTLSVNDMFANNITVENLTITDVIVIDLSVVGCLADLCVSNLSAVDMSVSGTLSMNDQFSNTITVENLTATDAIITNATITNLSVIDCIDELCVINLSAVDVSVSGTLSVNDQISNHIMVDTLSVTDLIINNVSVIDCVDDLCVLNLSVVDGSVSGTLSVNNEIVTNITATNLSATDAVITNGTVVNLSATDAVIDNLTVINCMASLCVNDLSVVDGSVSGTLSVNDLVIGSLDIACDLTVGCNISLNDSISPSVGNLIKASNRFMHNFGTDNTFLGMNAGNFTLTGIENVGIGRNALFSNTVGFENVAVGGFALPVNTVGAQNVAFGTYSLLSNIIGVENTAMGVSTLRNHVIGTGNAAVGFGAGLNLLTGDDNVIVGNNAALLTDTGSTNIMIGYNSGLSLITGNDNIYIANPGQVTENGTIRIGTPATHNRAYIQGVFGSSVSLEVLLCPPLLPTDCQLVGVEASGKLGMGVALVSSRRFKHNIESMADKSANIYKLRPVTFAYNNDETETEHYGLIAEEVDQVLRELVVYDEQEKPYTVHYHLLPNLLLNEVQRLHGIVQGRTLVINKLTAGNKKIAATIQMLTEKIASLGN